MKLKDLASILKTAALEGADKALTGCGGLSIGITKAEAYRLYGRGNVDRWLLEGLIQVSNKNIDRVKLERVAAASNRRTYLPVTER